MTCTKRNLVELFKKHRFILNLGQIIKSGLGYEWRARATELRREGWCIILDRAKKPSDNLYYMAPPKNKEAWPKWFSL